jgi:hypothetical protein
MQKIVKVDLSDIIGTSLEDFLDILSNAAVGNDLLMDISYKVVGHKDDLLFIEVDGDASEAEKFGPI